MSNWREDYENNGSGVDPNDYEHEDDFFDSLRNSERRNAEHSSSSNNKGCYIATCVYGSYDCPEVWTLRRYRDSYLESHLAGRIFIRVYYFISPKLVRIFGKTKWFNNVGHFILDKYVSKLNTKGFSSDVYID